MNIISSVFVHIGRISIYWIFTDLFHQGYLADRELSISQVYTGDRPNSLISEACKSSFCSLLLRAALPLFSCVFEPLSVWVRVSLQPQAYVSLEIALHWTKFSLQTQTETSLLCCHFNHLISPSTFVLQLLVQHLYSRTCTIMNSWM